MIEKNTPFIVAPSQMVLKSEKFQIKLRDRIVADYAELKQAYAARTGRFFSSPMYQEHICRTLCDYDGDIYRCDEQGSFHKRMPPNDHFSLYYSLGEGARWLRDFMALHRERRDYYKLELLALYIGIRKPLAYEGLITLN